MRVRVKGEGFIERDILENDDIDAPADDENTNATADKESPVHLIKERLGRQKIPVDFDMGDGTTVTIYLYRLRTGELMMINENVFPPAVLRDIQNRSSADSEDAGTSMFERVKTELGLSEQETMALFKKRAVHIVMASLVTDELKDEDWLTHVCDEQVLYQLHDIALGRQTGHNTVSRFLNMDSAA